MPTIIDRYMLRQFTQVFIICFLSLVGLYTVIDLFGHLDHFVDFADEHGGLLVTLASFYGFRTLWFFDRLSGVLTLTAVMFTVTWIQRHNEMTALLAAGIPRLRVLRPVLIAAIGVSLLAAASREMIIPNIRHKLAIDSRNLAGQQEVLMQPRFDSQTEILIGGEKIIPADQAIVDANFVLPRALDQFGRRLIAREARFLPAKDALPSGYLLSGVTTPRILLEKPSLEFAGQTVVLTPHDAKWLQPDQLFVVSGVSFEFLSAGSSWRDFASTRELVHEMRSPSTDLGADVRVAIHSRFLQPFVDTTLIFLGLPFVVTRSNRNPFIAVGLCLAVVTVFMIVALGCQSLGTTGWLQPTLAAWLPLMIFAPIAVGLSDSLQQ
ncbi:MAG: LptF/LptG family permease [Planctomycetes bacterium]|nr:LptF/LptG family permease [Planctomycetota bacterium]